MSRSEPTYLIPPSPTWQQVDDGEGFDDKVNVVEETLAVARQRGQANWKVVSQLREAKSRHDADPRVRVRALIRTQIARVRIEQRQLSYGVIAVFYANILILAELVLFIGGTSMPDVGTALTTVARIAALLGTYLLLVQLLLVGRLPWLDSLYGMDKLTRWHKTNGHLAFTLIMVHAAFVVIGRAMAAGMPVMDMGMQVVQYKYMPEAIIGLLAIVACVATSIRAARSHMKHERWHSIHLWAYVGVLLSFGHELYGPDFSGHMAAQSYLWVLYASTFGMILYYRVYLPVARTFRHQLRVDRIVQESDNVVSIYMRGYNLDALAAQPGQFFYWRFLTREDCRETHPYSLSVAPNPNYLRITVKNLGDASGRISRLKVGTWVAFEGPYGGFTPAQRKKTRGVLIAGGVGISPVLSLFEGMLFAPGDLTMIYRAHSRDDLVLLNELSDLSQLRNARVRLVIGSRSNFPPDRQPLSPEHLLHIVPDIQRRDVYLCANASMTDAVLESLRLLGVPEQQIHCERFAM